MGSCSSTHCSLYLESSSPRYLLYSHLKCHHLTQAYPHHLLKICSPLLLPLGFLLVFSCSVVSDSLQPHKLQHTRLLGWLLSKINKNNKSWWGYGENGILIHWLLVRMKNGAASTEHSMEAPQKMKNYHRTQQLHFWVYTRKRVESRILKRYLYSHVHSSIIRNSQKMKAT